ncbi:MAG: response regulator [Desulfuromonadales bacterium]|nr:MAG: response regulator [Desulfuromonadales bacterium]
MSFFAPRNRIGARLFRQAVLLALALSVVFSAVLTAIEYRRSAESLRKSVELLEKTQHAGITAALWSFDRQQIAAQMEGIRNYPFISYVAILDQGKVIMESGARRERYVDVRTVTLSTEYNGRQVPVGSLYIELDRLLILRQALATAVVTLAVQTTTIIIVMLFAFMLFERQVTRHLVAAATYFTSLDIARVKRPLHLEKPHYGDEIDALVDAFNEMREYLAVAYQQQGQAQKMEAVGRLAGGVAHDYNNKLTVILGYAQLLRSGGLGQEDAADQLEEIIKAAEHSRDITRQLLTFSRNEAVAPTRVDLNLLISRAEKSLFRLIGEDISLRMALSPDLWPVRIDPTQMDQLLMNLVLNARDAIAGNGSVTVGTENVVLDDAACGEIQGAVPGEFVLLTVSDTGSGMDSETMEHIFEPFFSTKELGKGTGLGLATVYGIVQQNDGAITVKSEPGAGTVFSVCLPRFSGEGMEADTPPVSRPAAPGGTVLLVDDDEAIRQITARMLRHSGFRVLVAEGAEEAIGICQRSGTVIDLILTDVIMPTMNAGEMIPIVMPHQPKAKVLYMSGYSADIVEHRGVIGAGASFIRKPFSLETLREKIGQVMG